MPNTDSVEEIIDSLWECAELLETQINIMERMLKMLSVRVRELEDARADH